MARDWYCFVLGQELGPMEFHDVRGMVASRQLVADDYVRRDGDTEWRRAADLTGLFPKPATVPQPAPDTNLATAAKRMRRGPQLFGSGDDAFFRFLRTLFRNISDAARPQSRFSGRRFLILLAAVVTLAAGLSYLTGIKNINPSDWQPVLAAHDAVKQHLKFPLTAEFGYDEVVRAVDGWTVTGNVQCKNAFGVPIEHSFVVRMTPGCQVVFCELSGE